MSQSNRFESHRFEASGFGPYQNMVQSYFGGLDQAAQGFEPMMKGIARAQLEMVGLVSRRTQAYFEIPSRLAQVRTPQDLMAEQMRFWQIAFQQYSESSRRVATAMAAAMTPPVNPFLDTASKQRSRDYLTMPEQTDQPAAVREPGSRPTGAAPRRVA
jgi:hypothetical protein